MTTLAGIRRKKNADALVKGTVTTIMSTWAWTLHSAIFIVADEGDHTGNTQNGGWDLPAGCCDSPVLPAGDPDISATWPGGLYGGGLVPAIIIDPGGPRHYPSSAPSSHCSLLRTIEDDWGLGELGFTSGRAQVTTMTSSSLTEAHLSPPGRGRQRRRRAAPAGGAPVSARPGRLARWRGRSGPVRPGCPALTIKA
jgi:hypothetical protein